MSQTESIAKRLSELRKKKGIKQDEIADYLGVRRATVANYETGNRSPDCEMLAKLADYYGVTCDYLIRGVRSKFVDIHKSTGLSDKAIKILLNMKSANLYFYINMVNFLIEETEIEIFDDEQHSLEKGLLQKLYEYFLFNEPKKKQEFIVSSDGDIFNAADFAEEDLQLVLDTQITTNNEARELYISKINAAELLEALKYERLTEQIKESKKKFLHKAGDNNADNRKEK